MPVTESRLPIGVEADIVLSRQRSREAAKALGFSMTDQSRIATAVSELTRNVVRYATDGRGTIVIRPVTGDSGATGIEIVVSDDGPGIADVEAVMLDGFTTGPGLGLGLPGTRRLMDEMLLDTALGRGTTVTIRKWRR